MSQDINNCTFAGRITKDFELSTTQGGIVLAKSSLANNGRDDKANFIELVVFGKSAEIIQKYTEKGSQLIVTGRLAINNWEDKTGNKRTSVELVVNDFQFIGAKSDKPLTQAQALNGGQDFIVEDIEDSPVDLLTIPF